MKKIFLALALLFALAPFMVNHSDAGGYGHGYGYGYQNYGYGYNYQNYHQVYEVNPVVVIGVPVSNLGVPFYWSVGQELREERIAEKAAALVNKNKDNSGQIQQVQRQQPQVAPAPGPGVLLDFDLVGSEIAHQTQAQTPSISSELDSRVQKIFSDSCIRCHKPGSDKPALRLVNADGGLFKSLDWKDEFKRRQSIYDAVRGTEGVSQMPKNADQLNDESIEVIYLWLREHSSR